MVACVLVFNVLVLLNALPLSSGICGGRLLNLGSCLILPVLLATIWSKFEPYKLFTGDLQSLALRKELEGEVNC